jgi:transcriptional regulator with XRE-family HTH domain
MNTIGQRIKNARNEKKITQPELAQLVGVSKATISFWETDVTKPKINSMEALASALGVTFDYLNTGKSNSTNKKMLELVELLSKLPASDQEFFYDFLVGAINRKLFEAQTVIKD